VRNSGGDQRKLRTAVRSSIAKQIDQSQNHSLTKGQAVLYHFCTAEPGEMEFLEFSSLYFL
jgi:hypothetical protein